MNIERFYCRICNTKTLHVEEPVLDSQPPTVWHCLFCGNEKRGKDGNSYIPARPPGGISDSGLHGITPPTTENDNDSKEDNIIMEDSVIKEKSYSREMQVREFLRELNILCKKHNVSISHEDEHGAFLLIPFDQDVMEWLLSANYGRWNIK